MTRSREELRLMIQDAERIAANISEGLWDDRAGFYSASEESMAVVVGYLALASALRLRAQKASDSDGSPEGRDAQRLDGEAATALAEGIAQDTSHAD